MTRLKVNSRNGNRPPAGMARLKVGPRTAINRHQEDRSSRESAQTASINQWWERLLSWMALNGISPWPWRVWGGRRRPRGCSDAPAATKRLKSCCREAFVNGRARAVWWNCLTAAPFPDRSIGSGSGYTDGRHCRRASGVQRDSRRPESRLTVAQRKAETGFIQAQARIRLRDRFHRERQRRWVHASHSPVRVRHRAAQSGPSGFLKAACKSSFGSPLPRALTAWSRGAN